MLKKTALLLTLLSQLLMATPPSPSCTKETKALGLCDQLVKDLTEETTLLKQKVADVAEQRDAAEKKLEIATRPPTIPEWGWFVIGIVTGAGAYAIIRR